MIEFFKQNKSKKQISPSSLTCSVSLTNLTVTSARFVEIKVENVLTWFLICLSKKINMKYGLMCFFFFLCKFKLE